LGQWAEAETTYRESLALRRQQRERLGNTPETVRDLSIALDNVGRVAEALGQRAEARAFYQEALILCRRLDLAFPDNTEHQKSIQNLESKLKEA
jgi:tetratricopeptide (TPR) repeat protein